VLDDTGSSPALYFIYTDQLGTPQKITNGTINVVWDGVFNPFGDPASEGSDSATWGAAQWGSFNWGATGPSLSLTNLRFPGQYFDSETVLNQNWSRDYDPTVGRYIQSDPAGLISGPNTYNYAAGNPLLYSDCSAPEHCLTGSRTICRRDDPGLAIESRFERPTATAPP
jgi:RHS repeat-associated protein